ncbi:MAG: response regulator [Oligoflexales bacterium]
MNKVLIVDDSPDILDLIESCIEDVSTTVFKALDVKSGWVTFKETKPDLVITDYKMPDADGYELVKLIKKESPHCPVILVTGYSGVDDDILSLFTKVFTKPFPSIQLKKTVTILLEKKEN